MTSGPSLTPEAAVGWLRSLSVDIREAAVFDASGSLLAGDPTLADAPAGRGILVTRSDRRAIVVRHGRRALLGVLRSDMEAALAALEAA
jgi:hypothetical protein